MSKYKDPKYNILNDHEIYIHAKNGIEPMSEPYNRTSLDYNEYKINSYNFRSKELTKKSDLLVSGCSFTYGLGVPQEEIWSSQIARKLDIEHDNIAGFGKSVPWIVNNIFNYFKEFGHPKIVMCLFPDFLRMELLSDSTHMDSLLIKGFFQGDLKKYSLMQEATYKDMPIFSKKPHIAENIFPPETLMYLAFQYIKMLEMYCNSNDIKFIWSTWQKQQLAFLKNNIDQLSFTNFIPIDSDHWHCHQGDEQRERFHKDFIEYPSELCNCKWLDVCNTYTDCHSELRDKYGKNFDVASDMHEDHPSWHHIGIHQHIHIAESFLESL